MYNKVYDLFIRGFKCCRRIRYAYTSDDCKFDFTGFLKPNGYTKLCPFELCQKGNLVLLRQCVKYDLNKLLLIAVENNHKNIVEYLIDEGASSVDDALFLACSKNFYDISELLVKRGAKIVFGLRSSKSPNILRMLYRYEQGSEVIM
jgi:hypothetical protein